MSSSKTSTITTTTEEEEDIDNIDSILFPLFSKLFPFKGKKEESKFYIKYSATIENDEQEMDIMEKAYIVRDIIKSLPQIPTFSFSLKEYTNVDDINFLNFKYGIQYLQKNKKPNEFLSLNIDSHIIDILPTTNTYKEYQESLLHNSPQIDHSKDYQAPNRYLGMKKAELISLSIVIIIPLLLILITILMAKYRIRKKYKKDFY